MYNIMYVFPDGMEVDVDKFPKHFCDKLPLFLKIESGIEDEGIKYSATKDKEKVEDFIKKYPDAVAVETINQYDEKNKTMVDSKIYSMIGTRSEPLYPIKDFEYTGPACNTKSNYKVKITIANEEYTRDFMVDVPTVNFKAYDALESAIKKLHEELLECKHGAEGSEYDDFAYSVKMYDKNGNDYEHEFEENRFNPPFKDMIVAIQIADFELVIVN